MADPFSFVLHVAQAVAVRLTTNNARLPILPSGVAFNTEFVFIGTIPTSGASLQSLLNPPLGSGPVWLDGNNKEFYSMLGEYTIINTHATQTLNIYIQRANQPATLKTALPPGAGFNETAREVNPIMMYLVSATPNTTITAQVNAWAYGANQ